MSRERMNAGSERQVREMTQVEQRRAKQRVEDLRWLLAQPAARRVLTWLIFEECALNETSYHPSGQQFAANEGRRGVGSQLQAELMNADLEGWLALIREHQVKTDV